MSEMSISFLNFGIMYTKSAYFYCVLTFSLFSLLLFTSLVIGFVQYIKQISQKDRRQLCNKEADEVHIGCAVVDIFMLFFTIEAEYLITVDFLYFTSCVNSQNTLRNRKIFLTPSAVQKKIWLQTKLCQKKSRNLQK